MSERVGCRIHWNSGRAVSDQMRRFSRVPCAREVIDLGPGEKAGEVLAVRWLEPERAEEDMRPFIIIQQFPE